MTQETFVLVKERCMLVNLNMRTERHGEDLVPADLVTSDHMPHLRFPFMGAISWEKEIQRTLLRVHDVDGEQHDVVLAGGRTNKFKLTMKEGGTVTWKFRVQFSKPDEDMVARLMRVLNQKVPVSLESVDEEEVPDNFEQVDQMSATGAPPSAARQAAEDLFKGGPESVGDVFDKIIGAEGTQEEAEAE